MAGGTSPERNVSLYSGIEITNALRKKGHEVMLLDLWKGSKSKDFPATYNTNFENKKWNLQEIPNFNKKEEMDDSIIELCKTADVVFLSLHGSIGENGKLQSILEMNQINFTGTGSVGSMLAMDKSLAKRVMSSYGIKTPKELEINNLKEQTIPFPCVIKPCSCGSSVGVSFVENEQELVQAINKAKEFEDQLMIEEKIEGREFSIGILNKKTLPIIEIIPEQGFYDYENKYNGTTKEICPAKIEESLAKQIEEVALKVHQALRLGDYSRIDVIVDKNKNIYCLEANTLPGMTPMSLFPQEAKAKGISFEDLCEIIALKKEIEIS